MATHGQQVQKQVIVCFYEFNQVKTVAQSLLRACTGFVHCGINLGALEDVSAWAGRETGACMLCTDVPMFGRRESHFLRLTKAIAVAVSDETFAVLLRYLKRTPEQCRHEPHIVMPCFGIRYPTMGEIMLDFFRSVVGGAGDAPGSCEKMQCAQFSLMTLMFLLQHENICEHPPAVLSQLAKRGCSLTPDALYHALASLCDTYPQIYHMCLSSDDSGSNIYLDTPQYLVPMSEVQG